MINRRSAVAVTLSVLAAFAIAGESEAQENQRGFRVIPSFGSYVPAGDLGFGYGADDRPEAPEFLKLSRGIAVGLAIEAPVRSVLGLRGGVKYGFAGDLVAGYDSGLESCGANCQAVVYEQEPIADASALLISTDLTLTPSRDSWVVLPYAVGGIAYRRHYYEPSAVPVGEAGRQAQEQATRWIPHLGIGAELPIRSLALRLEAEMYGDVEFDGWKPHGGRYGDAFVSIGFSWSP